MERYLIRILVAFGFPIFIVLDYFVDQQPVQRSLRFYWGCFLSGDLDGYSPEAIRNVLD